jgi:hypothetical protein
MDPNIQSLDKLNADAKQTTEEVAQATEDLKKVIAEIPPERLKKLVFDLEVRMFGRGGMSQGGRTQRELIAGVERGCK